MVSLPTLTIKINHSCTGKYAIPMGGMRLDFEDLNFMANQPTPQNVSPSRNKASKKPASQKGKPMGISEARFS